jgi:hypothetical protein
MPATVLVVSDPGDIPTAPVDGKPTLVYWNILGLAQSIRLALIAAGVDFVDVRIAANEFKTPVGGTNAWAEKKPTVELQQALVFPNLPYFLHPALGARGLVQSDSILRFVGRHYGMLGAEPSFTDMYTEDLHDMEATISRLAYGKGPEAVLAWFQSGVPKFLAPMGTLLSGDIKLLSGEKDKPSVADWKLYVFLYKMGVIQEQLGDASTASILGADAAWVKPYMASLEAIPAMKTYMESASYMKEHLNYPTAKWQG